MTEPAWKAGIEAMDAEFDGDFERAEAAYLEALARTRKRKQEGRKSP